MHLLFSCVVDFFIDNGRELYGFGCIAFVLLRRINEFVDWFVCVIGLESFGHDSLSELKLSTSAAAAASFTKQICRFLPVRKFKMKTNFLFFWGLFGWRGINISNLLADGTVGWACVRALRLKSLSSSHLQRRRPTAAVFPHDHFVSVKKKKTQFILVRKH